MRWRACGGGQEFLCPTSRLATLRRVCIPWVSKVLHLGRNGGLSTTFFQPTVVEATPYQEICHSTPQYWGAESTLKHGFKSSHFWKRLQGHPYFV